MKKPVKRLRRGGGITFSALFAVLCLCWGLSACVSGPKSPFAPVYLTNRAQYRLLPPSEIEGTLDQAQQIEGSYGDTAFVMNAWVRADQTMLEMALFNSFGADMGALFYGEDRISFTSNAFPQSLKAEYIAADFQLCFYRAGALSTALKGIGLTLLVDRETRDGEPAAERRTVLDGNKPIIEIVKTQDHVAYTNLLRGYSYTLYGAFEELLNNSAR